MAQQPEEEEYDSDDGRQWDFNFEWDDDTSTILLTMKDGVSKQTWEKRLGKDQYADPSKEYDKMEKVFNDEKAKFDCGYDKDTTDVWIEFSKDGVQQYAFFLNRKKK